MYNQASGFPKIDKLDLMLLQGLESDARLSYKALASRSGASPPTVSRRLQRLLDEGITKIAVITDPVYLGYDMLLVLAVNVPPSMVNAAADRMARVDRIKYIWITTGRYDIIAWAFFRNNAEFMDLFPEELQDIPENVRIETISVIRSLKNSWAYLTDDGVGASPIRLHRDDGPTELDLSLIGELEKNPRGAIKDLSNKLGVSVITVRHKLRKLIQQGMIRIVSTTNPYALGYNLRGITLVQAHPASLNDVASKLAAYSQVKQLVITMGTFNCIIVSAYTDSNDMQGFLVGGLGEMPGIAKCESMVIMETRKNILGYVTNAG